MAVLGWPDGRVRPLLFGGSPVLPSGVHVDQGGRFLVGADAYRAARLDPARFEANPKRRIDQETLLLGDAEVRVVDLIGATLHLVATEATRIAGVPPGQVTVTYPVAWAGPRQAKLVAAAQAAGLGGVTLVPEPVAAATYFASRGAHGDLVVYDLGGGTCDVSIVRSSPDGLQVLESGGLDDLGGLDLDQMILEQIGAAVAPIAPTQWARLTAPGTQADRREAMILRDDVRNAKEALSRHPSVTVFVPLIDRDVVVSREAFERAAVDRLSPSADLTLAVIRRAGLDPANLAGLFLVGGSTRVPAVATLLHRRTGIAPTVLEQPELVVAEGALAPPAPIPHSAPPVSPPPPRSVTPQQAQLPPAPHRRRRMWTATAAVGLVAVVTAVVVLQAKLGDDGGRQPPPQTSQSQSQSQQPASKASVVASLPDPCTMAADLKQRHQFTAPTATSSPSKRSCEWHFIYEAGAGGLQIDLFLDTDAGSRGLFRSKRSPSPSSDEGSPEPISGLGDEAVLLREQMAELQQGTRLVIRDRNVLIEVMWYGYAPPDQDQRRFSFEQLRTDVVAVAREILSKLG
ncbi:hypothetical protein Vau01_114640 [Virgisporangium aurantiacum]|uniref:Hsp70 protein n=1 Tax=Virgisporangium aurantiacum TaxID=175570 RepID=A0A8J3ZJI1_9ACTN|nr:hypothetical protein Vau01_114640 [Virgisporangium aurantiacum]